MTTQADLRRRIAEFLRQPESRLDDAKPLADVITDSFAMVEMLIELQEELGLRFLAQEELRDVRTFGDLVRLLERHAAAAPAPAGVR